MSVLSTITRVLKRYGQPIELTTSGNQHTVIGVVVLMDSTTQGVFYDGNEAVGLLKPGYILWVGGSEGSPPIVNDVFFFQGRLLVIRKVHLYQIGTTSTVYEAVCD